MSRAFKESASTGMKPPSRKRRSLPVRPLLTDREAVRAVMSTAGFEKIEKLRQTFASGDQNDAFFWQAARERMVQSALRRPDSAALLMKAKLGAVGAMLGLTVRRIDALLEQVDVPGFVAAALANQSIQGFQGDPRFSSLWTEESIRANPQLRVEFEHAIVFGTISEAGDIAKSKSWGELIALRPLQPEDDLYPRNITYQLKATSKLRQRWEFRDNFKQILGPERRLVTEAMRSTKSRFLRSLDKKDLRTLTQRLDLTPEEFWRTVRHGDRLGPNAIDSFLQRLEERTKGYRLPFPPSEDSLMQIQPAPPIGGKEIA